MADITNVNIGTCNVSIDGVDVGHTKGDVVFTYEPSIHEVTVNKFGSTPAEAILVGERVTVVVPFAETSLANIQKVIQLSSTGGVKATIGGTVGDRIGATEGVELVLHPIANLTADLTDDIIIYKAVVISSVELGFMVEGEKIMTITFLALIDEGRTDSDQLCLIGDSTP